MTHAPEARQAQAPTVRRWRILRSIVSHIITTPKQRLPTPSPYSPQRDREATYRRVSRWRYRNPERQAALSAVATAIKYLGLKRKPCESCGTTKNVCADPISLHPLRVNWRCRKCSNAMRRKAARIDGGCHAR
jgi:hypothetical protein